MKYALILEKTEYFDGPEAGAEDLCYGYDIIAAVSNDLENIKAAFSIDLGDGRCRLCFNNDFHLRGRIVDLDQMKTVFDYQNLHWTACDRKEPEIHVID